MQFNIEYDIATYNELSTIASHYDNYYIYLDSEKMDELILRYLNHYRETCDDFHRPTAYEHLKRLAAYAYDEIHPNSIWKSFYVVWSHSTDYAGVAYTLTGESIGEEQSTKNLIAHDHDTTPNMIICKFATQDRI